MRYKCKQYSKNTYKLSYKTGKNVDLIDTISVSLVQLISLQHKQWLHFESFPPLIQSKRFETTRSYIKNLSCFWQTYLFLSLCSYILGMTPTCLVDLFIKRLALPTVTVRFILPWSAPRRWPGFCCILWIRMSDMSGPTEFRKFLTKSYFVFPINPTVDRPCFHIIRGERNVHKPTVHCYITIWNSHPFHHIIRTASEHVWLLWAVEFSLTWIGQPPLLLSS